MAISARGLLFDPKEVARAGVPAATLHEEARKLLLAEPAIDAAYTRAELESGSRGGDKHFDAIRRSWNRELSGDVEYALKPYWMMTSSSSVTTHGSPHGYDTHVPLAIYGPGWIRPGRRDGRVEIADLAPTFSSLLGIAAPSSAEGRVLPVSGAR